MDREDAQNKVGRDEEILRSRQTGKCGEIDWLLFYRFFDLSGFHPIFDS